MSKSNKDIAALNNNELLELLKCVKAEIDTREQKVKINQDIAYDVGRLMDKIYEAEKHLCVNMKAECIFKIFPDNEYEEAKFSLVSISIDNVCSNLSYSDHNSVHWPIDRSLNKTSYSDYSIKKVFGDDFFEKQKKLKDLLKEYHTTIRTYSKQLQISEEALLDKIDSGIFDQSDGILDESSY